MPNWAEFRFRKELAVPIPKRLKPVKGGAYKCSDRSELVQLVEFFSKDHVLFRRSPSVKCESIIIERFTVKILKGSIKL